MPSQTNVASFVLRFVQESPTDRDIPSPQTDWHAVIKHIQTNREKRFTCSVDALAFIANYVNLGQFAPVKNSKPKDDIPNTKTGVE